MQQPIVHHDLTPLHHGTPHHPARWRNLAGPWTLALIVMLLSGCDNVNWGGAHFAVIEPPPSERGTEVADAEEAVLDEQPPAGPVLYYVKALGEQALLVPIAEISQDTLLPIRAQDDAERYGQRFITQNLRQGTELALFHHGERAGTFVLQSAEIPGEEVCPQIPRATGVLELVASARDVTEFLAIAKTHTPPGGRRRAAATLEPDRRMPLQAGILAEQAIRSRGARLPNNWTRALIQLQAFPTAGGADPAFASTFLVGDSTGRTPNPSGYSLFLIAQPRPQVGYDTTFINFVDFATTGRAVPRVIDFLDWDHDGSTGLLLEVTSGQDTWFEALGSYRGRWRRILQTRCDRPPTANTEEETAETN